MLHESFAQDLPEADRWLIVASQRPITLGANTARTETAAAAIDAILAAAPAVDD